MTLRQFRNCRLAGVLATLALVSILTTPLQARDRDKFVQRLQDSTDVLREVLSIPEEGIPDWLLRKCEALVIIPSVVKAAFVFGAKRGHGIIVHRLPNGRWSSPAFLTITGGSFGLQIGGQATDIVLVVNSQRGYRALLGSKFKLGADASVAAGPVGRTAAAATDVTLKAEILAYSRSRGAFAGISLDGSALTMDTEANTAFYGKPVNPRTVLNDPKWPFPPEAQPLADLLRPFTVIK